MIVAIMTTALAGTVKADTVSYTATSNDKPTATNGTVTGTVTGTNSISWSYSVTQSTKSGKSPYVAYSDASGWQLGSGNSPCTAFSISTSGISGTITQIDVVTGSKSASSKINVTVGGNAFGTQNQNTGNGATVGTQTFTGSASGEIVVSASESSAAFYFKSVTVTYDDGGSTPQVISYDKNSVEVTYGEESSVEWPVLSNPGNVEVIYDSSDENVATVNATGAVTLIKPGTTTITATDGDNDASFVITYNKAAHGLNYETKSYTVKPGSSFATPTLTNPHNLTVTYTSSNTDVATVNATTGAVDILLVGTTTIRATFEGNDYYKAGYTTYTINVSNKDFSATGQWVAITSLDELVAGERYIFGDLNATYLMGSQNSNNRASVSVTNEEGIITLQDNTGVAPFILDGETGAWYFETSDGYLYAAHSSNNYLRSETTKDDNNNAKATISLNNSGEATVIFQGNNTRNHLHFNGSNNPPIFACYASNSTTGTLVKIYKEYTAVSIASPVISLASGTYEETQSVTITAEAGASIYYTLDGSTPTSGSTAYTGAISITESCTLKAIAIVGGESSNVASATYNLPLTTIAQVKENESNTEVTVNLTGAQVVYNGAEAGTTNSNKYIYIKDATGAICLYDGDGFNTTLVTGDILSGTITGTYNLYNGQPQIKSIQNIGNLTTTVNEAVVPIVVTTKQQVLDNIFNLVRVNDVTVYKNKTKFYTDSSEDIQIYDNFKLNYTIEENDNVDVQGIAMVFSGQAEIAPRSQQDIIEIANSEPVSISSSLGYSTYCSDNDLDFTAVDAIKVFYATVEGSTLTFHRINKVAAGTGVLLVSAAGGAVAETHVPFLTDEADDVAGNVFVRGTGAEVTYTVNDQNYILFNGDDGIGFYKANNNTVATNRAYIHVTSSGNDVKSFVINLEDDATGISLMEDGRSQMEDGVIYKQGSTIVNLAGQRLDNSQLKRGIYIVNGKKILK